MTTPVDRGYSWVILCVMWATYMLIAGCAKSFGLLYTELLHYYGTGSGNTAWIQSFYLLLIFGIGPFANYLGEIYTFRKVMFVGGILGSLGIFLSAFVTEMEHWYFTYGLITGIGQGLLFTPCTTVVNFYFDKRRALANGIVVGGSGFGAFLMPYVYRNLIDFYGLSGALIVVSAIYLNACVGAMLIRQPAKLQRQKKLRPSNVGKEKEDFESQPLTEISEPSAQQNKKVKQKSKCFSIRLQRPLFDFSLYKNSLYTVYTIGFVATVLGYGATFVIVPAHIHKSGYSKQDVAIGMSLIGAGEVFSRPFFGWFADLKLVRIKTILVFCLLISSIMNMIIPYFKQFYVIAIYCTGVGVFPAAFWSLLSVLVLETTTLERLSPALGLISLCLSFGVFIGSPIAGWIEDASGSWDNSFRYVAVCQFVAVLTFLSHPLVKKIWCFKDDRSTKSMSSNSNYDQDTVRFSEDEDVVK